MSNNIESNWIEAIKQKAEQATREVPEGAWEAISKSLPQQAPKESSTKRGRVAPRMWKAIAAAASVAIVATVGITLLNNNEQQPQEQLAKIAEKPKPTPQPQLLAKNVADTTSINPQAVPATATPAAATTALPSNTGQLLAKNTPAQHQPKSVAPKPLDLHNTQLAATLPTLSKPESTSTFKRHRSSHPQATPAATPKHLNEEPQQPYLNEQENMLYANEDGIYPEYEFNNDYDFNPDEYFYDLETMKALEELYAEYDNAMNQEAMQPWKAYTDSTYQQHLVYDANARRDARRKMALTKPRKKQTMLLAAYGNGMISTDHNSIVNGSSAQMLAPAATSNPGMMMAPAAPGVTPKVAPPVNYSYHHHMPLTAGITFNKRIVKNLYGSVGLNFTSMSSDVTPDNGSKPFDQNVKLIGLPFGVKWNFWQYKGLKTFVGGEALVEKVVSAKFNNESVTIKRLQWSVHATAGLQYNFTRHFGVYLAPKLSHYITTMPLNTQRNEHPLNFNLQLGLSFDF